MKIYLVEGLEDPVLLVINIYFILLNSITQLSQVLNYPILVANVGFVGNYLLNIYEDIFSRRSGRSGVIIYQYLFYITQLSQLLNYTILSLI